MRKRNLDKSDIRLERQIVTALITSDSFLREMTPILSEDVFRLPWAKTVYRWCSDFYEHEKEAPKKHVEDFYLSQAPQMEESQADLLKEFLGNLSENYKEESSFNEGYIAKRAETYARKRRADKTQKEIKQHLSVGNIDEAEAAIQGYRRIVRPSTRGIDPFSDTEAIERAFDDADKDVLFRFPGALGELVGDFYRGGFFIIVGSTGKGKSFLLQEIALRCALRGKRVLLVNMEMGESRLLRRLFHRLTGMPIKRHAGRLLHPVFDCEENQVAGCGCGTRLISSLRRIPEYDQAPEGYAPCTICRKEDPERWKPATWWREREVSPITADVAKKKAKAIQRSLIRGKKLKLLNPPPLSMKASDLRTQLDIWETYEGWIPDVIVTDYLDKFAPEDKGEYRHQIYQTTLVHRALSLERNILIVSASQSNTARDDERNLRSGSIAEDIRKKAEVDFAMGLNQTDAEKQRGVMRVAVMKQRDDFYSINKEVMVLQNLMIGRPVLDSCFAKKIS